MRSMKKKNLKSSYLLRCQALFYLFLTAVLYRNWKGFVNVTSESAQSKEIQLTLSASSHDHRDRSELAAVRRCDEVELQRIEASPFLRTARRLHIESSCPNPTWLNTMLDLDYNKSSSRSHAKRLLLSVGCNTALDAVGLAHEISHNPIFDVQTWTEQMQNVTGHLFKPVCPGATQQNFKSGDAQTVLPIEIHCIEPIDNTINAIKETSQQLGLDQHGFHSHQYVMSNSTGVISFPTGDVGVEYLASKLCGRRVMGKWVRCHDVPMMTLDDFAMQHLPWLSESDQTVDILTIDTEGFDWRVLQGARSIVSRTRYIEFEYHAQWGQEELLKDAVDYLENLGFVCYFAGKERLFKLTNGCWVNRYEARVWSNVACVHRSEPAWLDIMEDYFQKTLRTTKLHQGK